MAVDEEAESAKVRAQSADPRRNAPLSRLAWVGAWLTILTLAAWTARLLGLWLLLAGLGTLLWTVVAVQRRDRAALGAALALWLAVGVAAGVQHRLSQVAGSWPQLRSQLEERAATALNDALDGLVERGEEAVAGVEAAVAAPGIGVPSAQLFQRLEWLQLTSGVSAVALFDPSGMPLAWAGEHRGTVPIEVRLGELGYVYHEGPLFSYLYFVRPLENGRIAAAAVLLEANLSAGEGVPPFAEWFAARHGLTPRFSLPDRATGESVWDWSTDRPILSVSFATLTQQHWWERVVERGRRAVGLLWLVGLVLLSVTWYRGRMGTPGVPVAVATAGVLLLPLGAMVEREELFSPLQFVLPAPWDVTLGMLLALLTGTAVWLLTRTPRERGVRRLPLWLQAGVAAAVFPLGLGLVARSAASGFLASHAGGGMALQLATTLLLALPLYLLLRARGRSEGASQAWAPLFAAGVLLSVLLGVGMVALWHPHRPVPVWAFALWGIPFALIALAESRGATRPRPLRGWLIVGWLASTAVLPMLWTLHTGARLAVAERELARLGTEADPFLDFLLRQFGERTLHFAREGESGINLLYHSWLASGLAREGYEARLTIWNEGSPETELRLSERAAIPDSLTRLIEAAARHPEPVLQQYTDVESLHYLLMVALPDGRVISVAVPPRYRVGRATALARFLQPETEVEVAAGNELLHLVPISAAEAEQLAGKAGQGRVPRVEWSRTEEGWRSEARARFPSGWMHAHLTVRATPLPLLLVRALLVVTALLAGLVLLWLIARLLCGDLPLLPVVRRQWVRSFRGRLAMVLFVFFLVPMAVFGAVSYGAVAREVVRSATSLARRALEQAAREAADRPLATVGEGVGADLLLYRQGTLVAAAAPEVIDLGLFHTWLPPSVFLKFASGEHLEEREERRLAERDYLVAYRRLAPSVVLAAPIPLASEEITRRQREFAHIALLMSLLGAAFSVVLSLLVSRALSRPLDELGHAVATVGAGNLRVRLPETRLDEFGGVYQAFNRMVRRLHSARVALVRETRRTETIVAEAATGVLALDGEARVELVNPRAAEILEAELRVGQPLPRSSALLDALAAEVDAFLRSGAAEAGPELEVEGRIVRLRLRRLADLQGERGVVVALEDVTAEIRTARVLAWGEMARQVAHEIKNPLTPIKLSVQHVRRAFTDYRPDFGEILERNVEAILKEIDRLGEIARAFSRFGTPLPATAGLEEVDLGRAIQDTLAIYRSGEDGIRYRVELDPQTPPRVTARTGELKEVLVNLLENAREALDGAGEIRIAARPVDDDRVELEIADTGEGIAPDQLPRIFEPHFSTRSSGTGLGLAIVRRLVESWGGEVTAESEPGAGTRIRLLLRRA